MKGQEFIKMLIIQYSNIHFHTLELTHRRATLLLIIHVTLGGIEAQIECSAPLNPSLYHSLIIHVYYRPSKLLICQDNENMLIRELLSKKNA